MAEKFFYLVEGENEKVFVDCLKSRFKIIEPGKSRVFNVLLKKISPAILSNISPKTNVVLIFDTDVDNNLVIFKENIKKLEKSKNVKNIVCIPQCKNFEDEIVRSTCIKNILEFFPSNSKSEFKKKFNSSTDEFLESKLKSNKFNILFLWNQSPIGIYSGIKNDFEKIKLKCI